MAFAVTGFGAGGDWPGAENKTATVISEVVKVNFNKTSVSPIDDSIAALAVKLHVLVRRVSEAGSGFLAMPDHSREERRPSTGEMGWHAIARSAGNCSKRFDPARQDDLRARPCPIGGISFISELPYSHSQEMSKLAGSFGRSA